MRNYKYSILIILIVLLINPSIGMSQVVSEQVKNELANLYNKSQEELSEGRFVRAIELKTSLYNMAKESDDTKIMAGIAAFELAQYYSTVENNLNKYIDWLRKSDQCDFPVASGRLGDAYLSGKDGVERDYHKAKYYYDKSNEGRCKWIIATMYSENGELGRNDSEFLRYANMAVEKKDPDAEFVLGLFYLDGNIVKKDYNKGVELIKKSAQQNNIKAIKFLEEFNIRW